MKCPRCKGYGRAIVLVKQKEGFYGTEQAVCPECNGKGIVEQTNEGFLRSCTTEELAEALFHIMASNEFTMYLIHTEKKSVQDIKNVIMEWLQEVHTEDNP